MATSRPMPRLLKATYLADQEFLLEETRATKLFYFPGPILFTLIMAVLASLTAASYYNWTTLQLGAWNTFLSKLGSVNSNFPHWLLLLFAFLVLVGLLWIVVRMVRWVRTVYAVTSHRVIVQTGILGKDFHEIPVTQVRGVDVHQSFFQRILGYGTVRVSSEGGSTLGNEDWKGIPKPFRFQKMIENASQGVMQNAGQGGMVRS
jgi:membrane protein YdbS with pleckstrin-like domain